MAPLGRLLAYYVRENGEGVADNLQFAVKPFFENQVSSIEWLVVHLGCLAKDPG